MPDLVLTGATRGIGRALALALAERRDGSRLLLAARDGARLDALASECSRLGTDAVAMPGDIGTLASARDLGDRIAKVVRPGATLIHNAGSWPSRREIGPDGFERAFVVNHLGGLAMQEALLEARLVRRIMVVSAGLLIKGRFDAKRTPKGDDFSSIRTYCTTKLCFAVAMRGVASAHPDIDVVILHPGVVRTDLGARKGPFGWLLSIIKRSWESPETCAARLVRILDRPRWSESGKAKWLVEEEDQPWPRVTEDPSTVSAIRHVTAASLDAET